MKTAVWYKINIQGHQPLSPPTHYHCTPMVLCYIYNRGQNLSLIRLHSVLQSTEKHILLLRINENNVHQWQMLSVVVVTEQCLSPGRKITQIFPSRGTQEALWVMSSSPVQVCCEQHIQIAWMIRYFGYSFGEPEVNVNLFCEWRERKTLLQGRQAKSGSQRKVRLHLHTRHIQCASCQRHDIPVCNCRVWTNITVGHEYKISLEHCCAELMR